jgi:hypothetical protein
LGGLESCCRNKAAILEKDRAFELIERFNNYSADFQDSWETWQWEIYEKLHGGGDGWST